MNSFYWDVVLPSIRLDNMSGKTSVYTKWRDTEIMWHVSTKMPYFSADPQQVRFGCCCCVPMFSAL